MAYNYFTVLFYIKLFVFATIHSNNNILYNYDSYERILLFYAILSGPIGEYGMSRKIRLLSYYAFNPDYCRPITTYQELFD